MIVKVTANMIRELALEVVTQGFALGQEFGIDRYLLDLPVSRNLETVFGSYESAPDDLALLSGQSDLLRAVMLVTPQDNSHDFSETVLRNAGLDVMLFRNGESARQHLLRDWPSVCLGQPCRLSKQRPWDMKQQESL